MNPMRRALCSLSLLLAAASPAPTWAAEPTVLTVPRFAQFDSLDPQRGFDVHSDIVVHAVYSNLLTYSYLERPYKLAPDLLEALPTLSPDKLTLTFKLRHGVRFSDNACFAGGKGRELTSDDVLFTIRRYADARINDKSWFAMDGAVVGLDDYRAATAKAAPDADLANANVAGLRKIDAWTFTIRLTHDNPLFLYSLAMSPTAIVPPEAVRFYKDKLGINAAGSGPFTLAQQADRKGVLRFLKNPNYYRNYPSVGAPGDAEKGLLKDAGKRLPFVDVLEMPLIEEAQPAALKFLRGEIDWRLLDRANFTKLVKRGPDGAFQVVDDYVARFGISYAPSPGVGYYILNMKDPILGKNKALRQALAAAVDPQAMSDVLLNGRSRKLDSIVPYELAGNERETGAPPRRHDVALARKLLAEAGYPGGAGLPPLTVSYYFTDADTHNQFDLLRSQFAAVGVQLKGAFMDLPTFTKVTGAGNFQLASSVWTADYPDAENFYQLLYSKNGTPGPNTGSFANAAYDRAYEASRYMLDGPQRIAQFKAMNAIINDEAPAIGMINPLGFGIYQKWVGNFKRNMLVPESMYLRVDAAAKKKGP
ncbi:MAG: ABC transporter substrate-binding protein [Betaproteobacteria bacterium]